MSHDATTAGMARGPLWPQAVAVFLAGLVLGAFLQINPGYVSAGGDSQWMWQRSRGLPPGDGYYHIRMACLYRTGEIQAAGGNFHWTRESLWNGGFADKDYLYHLALVPFTFLARDGGDYDGLIAGAKLSAAAGTALLALAFWGALALLGVPRPWLWVAVLAAAGGRMLLARASEPRSWVLGVAFCLLGHALLARRMRAWLFVLATAYVLAYTGSHLLPALAGLRLVAALALPPSGQSRAVALRHEALSLAAVLAGFAAGWLLHPQPENLARLWWVQNVLVPQAANYGHVPQALRPLSEAILGWAPGTPWPSMTPALFGGEMRPPGLARLAADFWYVAAAPLAMGAMLALRRRPGREAVLATVVAAGFTMLLVRHERFAEYAAPWWALALALWPWPRLAWRPVLPAAVVLLAAAVAVQAARAGNALGYLGPGVFRPCGDWMAGQPELRDAVVYNHSWDAFSELFFYRPDASYMVGLDPMFAVARGTENSRRWLLLMQGRAGEVAPDGPGLVRVLRDDFGAQYLFVHRLTSQRFFDQTLQMARSGQLEVAFDGRGQGCMLYRLPRAP